MFISIFSIMSTSKLSTGTFPNSKKVYCKGTLHPIRVAMREISLSPTKLDNGAMEVNPALTVYDTSGPYTDVEAKIDIEKGLNRIRDPWIRDRQDVDYFDRPNSAYGNTRLEDPLLDQLRFKHQQAIKCAKPGKCVTQLHYAKKGIITAEMEYVAIRENQKIDALKEAAMR